MRKAGLRHDLPLFPNLQDLFEKDEDTHHTLFSVVEDQETVDQLIEAVIRITGNLDDPHSGFLFVVPVLQVYRMRYSFSAALGDRYECANPSPHEWTIEFTPKIKLQIKRDKSGGGCG